MRIVEKPHSITGRGSDRISEQPLLSPSNFLKNKKAL
nr:MAG TPA: hypothetical protein [Caudoviricetes sp.]